MNRPNVILGSGMAGLGAAYRLHCTGAGSVLFDQHAYYGGHTSSHRFQGGWTFDEGPHISFTKDERIRKLLAANVNGDYQSFVVKVNNYWKGHWIKHPAQINLHGLPVELVARVLEDFVTAQNSPAGEIRNYEDWLRASFGDTFAETFPMEYTIKYHTTEAANLNTEWIGPRLYRANLKEVLLGALGECECLARRERRPHRRGAVVPHDPRPCDEPGRGPHRNVVEPRTGQIVHQNSIPGARHVRQ